MVAWNIFKISNPNISMSFLFRELFYGLIQIKKNLDKTINKSEIKLSTLHLRLQVVFHNINRVAHSLIVVFL